MNIEEVAMSQNDQEYFAARLAAERASARAAASQRIRTIHLQLAQAYEARLTEANGACESQFRSAADGGGPSSRTS
jgi:hypothetical protein